MLPAKILAALLELTNDRPDLTAQLLRGVLAQDPTRADVETYRRCSAWLASLNDRGRDAFVLADGNKTANCDLALDRLRRPDESRLAGRDRPHRYRNDARRGSAIGAIRSSGATTEHRALLAELLTPQSPSTVQIEAVRVLTRDRDDAGHRTRAGRLGVVSACHARRSRRPIAGR